ncbi:DUF2789 domain-containing protein [Shewanella surugensis]|uniref:DUF2789 domain-containing protein n=1 Tax=Shewanella surugensis TaxID=212020 RepID=UPI0028A128E1|nr:DUF2789 domain-containing protein [Shewanella surugensis]
MDTTPAILTHLFDQLGLMSSTKEIERFIDSHTLEDNIRLYQADFWSLSQKNFLKESLEEDAQWSGATDCLDTLLRKKTSLNCQCGSSAPPYSGDKIS